LDSDSHIETDVLCIGYGTGCIRIGQHSYIGVRNVLDWSDNLVIGDFVHIAGPSTGIWTHSSALQALHGDALANKSRRTTQPVHIANRVYIGGNCTVYPGVTIGSGSIILPNSAVPSDVEPGVLAGGVPARVVRRLQD
jgi:acetyltransferase-like isoleucine patch superfamily enzyme